MLNLIITSTEKDVDVFKSFENLVRTAEIFDKDLSVFFLANENDKHLKDFAILAAKNKDCLLFVADHKTSKDELIFMALDYVHNNDCLLCTIDTLSDVLSNMLEKWKKDFQIVRVRQLEEKGKNFFSRIGIWAYNFGLKLYGKKDSDYFGETDVQFLDGRIVESLSQIVKYNKTARVCRHFKQVKNGLIEEQQIYQQNDNKQKRFDMFSYGLLTSFYILILLALLCIFPILNGMVYSWWIIIAIVLWTGFGLYLALLTSKRIFLRRFTPENRVDLNDQPLFDILYSVQFDDPVEDFFEKQERTERLIKKIEEQKSEKPLLKSKASKLSSLT